MEKFQLELKRDLKTATDGEVAILRGIQNDTFEKNNLLNWEGSNKEGEYYSVSKKEVPKVVGYLERVGLVNYKFISAKSQFVKNLQK